ncbi:hypothetical protein O2K51_03790 [Apibacter raozihei]|uniref:hypothetical protein n=1 Tax=Apibacter raozihei TaxID=2500547 RepID=UPI000FE3AEBC|nr:hypothetical protein [Apibacter raozihei]
MRLEFNFRKKIIIDINDSFFYKKDKVIWWGYPISKINLFELEGDLSEKLNQISGYFLYLYYNDNEIIISSDITGGYRLYKYEDESILFLTNNYNLIIDYIKNSGHLEIDEIQVKFWKKHRYTFGDRTFIKKINKLPPHSTFRILKNGKNTVKSYFKKDLKRKPDKYLHKKLIRKDIIEVFSYLTNVKNEIVILFSGGKDSVFLVSILKELKINFKAVFLYAYPEYESNYNDFIRAKEVADHLDIDFIKVEVDLEKTKKYLIDNIVNEMFFDKHYSLLHFGGFQKLKDIFTKDTIFINGQSSDSILSFGPSEKGIGSLLKRIILYSPNWVSFLPKKIFEHKNNLKLKLPKNKNEKLIAFTDEKEYIFLLNDFDLEYIKSIEEYNTSITKDVTELFMKQMLIKINTFLQGSDNQVAIKAPKYFGFNNVILPFAIPDLIYHTIEYKDNFHEIFFPKYAVSKENQLNVLKLKDKNQCTFTNPRIIENEVYDFFDNKLNDIYYENFKI